MIWYDMIWYDMIWYHMRWDEMIWYDMIWYDVRWYDMIRYDMIWCDMIWYDTIWYEMTWFDMMWYSWQIFTQMFWGGKDFGEYHDGDRHRKMMWRIFFLGKSLEDFFAEWTLDAKINNSKIGSLNKSCSTSPPRRKPGWRFTAGLQYSLWATNP